ncbi:MAG: AI-2E family transporter [Oligoflexia bacterium]|nr:AI-2E family transporter [Oligoflexia bacterium]
MKLETSTPASKITFLILFVIVLILSFQISASYLIPITIGWMIAWTLKPLQQKLISLNLSHKLSATIVFIFLVAIVIVPLALFGKGLFKQATNLTAFLSTSDISLGAIFHSMKKWPMLEYLIGDPIEIEEGIKSSVASIGAATSSFALEQAAKIPIFMLQTLFVLLSCIFFLLDNERIGKFISQIIPLREDVKSALLTNIQETTKNSLRASFLVAITQGSIMFIAYLALNLPAPFLAGSATFIFSFIPFIGSTPVWILAALHLYLKGSLIKAIIMLIIGIITGLLDNIIRPYILKGAQEEIHPLVALVSIFGGIQVFGLFGVLIGPIIAVLFIAMCKVWIQIWNE